MELRRQQVVEKQAEVERLNQADEEQKARFEAQKQQEREGDTSKKLPAKPLTTTKKVSRDGLLPFRPVLNPFVSISGYGGYFEEAKGGR